jgi:hypothetical protein
MCLILLMLESEAAICAGNALLAEGNGHLLLTFDMRGKVTALIDCN